MDILIYTLGCPKNFNDSQVAAGILEAAGHSAVLGNDDIMETELAVDPADFDAIMVNTCGFIRDAKEESIDTILEMSKTGKFLIVSGCLPKRYAKELYDEMPEVDVFVGVNEYDKLPEIIAEHEKEQERILKVCEYSAELESEFRKMPEHSYSATLKIAEGCDNKCAYCAIPNIRGKYRSRPKELVVAEAKKLAESGVKEIILIAQDTTAYGLDIYGKYMLAELLDELCEIDGIRWIRLMYCYEDRITDELIDVIARQEKICKYLDIPLQHISDKVLKRMRRHSTKESITSKLKLLREKIPGIHIRTTLITGFPGETEEDFYELLDFVEDEKFERLGVFTFSPEEGTPAFNFDGAVDEDVKDLRKDLIMRKQVEISLACNEEKIGKTLDVLCEAVEEDGSYRGRTEFDAPGIDNEVIFNSPRKIKIGEIVKVKILDAFDYDLAGELA